MDFYMWLFENPCLSYWSVICDRCWEKWIWCELMACTAMMISIHNTLWRGEGEDQLPNNLMEIAADNNWLK